MGSLSLSELIAAAEKDEIIAKMKVLAVVPGRRQGQGLEGTPLLFTGDTLFPGGPGNTSFPDADFDTIIHSITTKLFTFPDDTIVLPGHGANTTIGTSAPTSRNGSNAAGSSVLVNLFAPRARQTFAGRGGVGSGGCVCG